MRFHLTISGSTLLLLLLDVAAERPAWAGPPPRFQIEGDHILVEGSPTLLKGVCYSPFIGGDSPLTGVTHVDFQKDMKEIKEELHANAVRVYDPLPREFYEAAAEADLIIIQGVYFPNAPDLLDDKYVSDRKEDIRRTIDKIHQYGASSNVLAYVLGSGISAESIEKTVTSVANTLRPRFKGEYYEVPPPKELPNIENYIGCSTVPNPEFPDPHPFQSFLAMMAEEAVDYELTKYGTRHFVGHAATTQNNPFLGARDRVAPLLDLPVDLGFLDIIFENIFTYNDPYIAFFGLPSYLEQLELAYPSKPVVLLETGYSTSDSFSLPPHRLCGYPHSYAPLTLWFGGASEEMQMLGIEARWVDVTCSPRPLAGFFVYGFYEEWWLTGEAGVQDDHPLEYFGIKRVRGSSDDFTVSRKPAFDRVAEMFGCEEPDADPASCGVVIRTPREIVVTYGTEVHIVLEAAGGASYHWSMGVEDALPAGLSFDESMGTIDGVPERIGSFRFRLRVEDPAQPGKARDRLTCLRVLPPRFEKSRKGQEVEVDGKPVVLTGREILLNGKPFFLKGVDYSPLTAGDAPWTPDPVVTHTNPRDDLKEIKEVLHVNTIRVYQSLPKEVYDAARENGLFIIQGIHLQVNGPWPQCNCEDPQPPDEPDCFPPPDLLDPAIFGPLKEHVLSDVETIHNFGAGDLILCWVVGNELNFTAARCTIDNHQDHPRYKGKHYSVPDSTNLPAVDRYDSDDPRCQPLIDAFVDPHPFQSFVTELIDSAATFEEGRMGRHNLFAHATDPNMSIAVSMKDRFYPEDHYPVDWGYLDIVFQNTYSYFPPFIRYHGYATYLELVQQAYPETPFVALECGYSTSPKREGTIFCATDAWCPAAGGDPLPMSLCFGTNSEEDQARGFATRWKEIGGLTAGFFVFEYFDEWWKGSNASEFVQDDNKAEEWFGIKAVSGTPDDFKVRNKPAFETVASMYDMSWCPTEIHCSASSKGVRIVISPPGQSGVESIVVRRDDGQTVDPDSEPLTYLDPAPLPGTHFYTVTKAYVECPGLTCSSSFQDQFLRGDSNGDGAVDLSDAVTTLGYLFLGGAPILCQDAADADDKGSIEITDAIYLLQHLFVGGPAIPPPGISQCGPDPTADELPACIQPESACAR